MVKIEDKVYVVIINYIGHLNTVECLESCLKLEYSNFQIIVVDNSPSNESAEYIEMWAEGKINLIETAHENLIYPLSQKPVSFISIKEDDLLFKTKKNSHKVILIKAKENKGFAAGNNIGLKYILNMSDANFVWLLNNDTVVEKGTLSEMVYSFLKISEQKKLGLLGCTLLYYNSPQYVQGIGGNYTKFLSVTKHVGDGKSTHTLEKEFPNLKKEVDYIIGASILTSESFVKEVGLLNEDYFLYFEELDWKKRGEKKGYTIDTCLARVYHKEGASINQNKSYKKGTSIVADFYSNRSRLIFTKMFFPKYLPLVYLSFAIVIYNRIKRKQFSRIKMILNIMKNPNSHLDKKYYSEKN